jgi:MinD-like ATPase involved in chromosome partitioning or flagellar assembly
LEIKRHAMETITFYSYKGGVGRTLALANIAIYLSRFGQNVCIIDFDLEAPGMHYKLPQLFSSPIKKGLVDYIYEFTSTGNIPASVDKFLLKAENIPDNQGDIRLIPAGNVLSAEYWQNLASIDWHALFYKEGGEGIPFFLELKEKIYKELKPDFLLIDSRTGITEMSGICTSVLPDKVVFLIINNRENIEGSRQILRGIQKAKRLKGQKPIEVKFALTRIPLAKKDEEKEIEKRIIEDIKNFLNEDSESLGDHLNISEITVLHSDRELELSEALRLNQKNLKDIPLAKDYLKLFSENIPQKIIKSKVVSVIESIITPEKLLEEPDRIQEELEALAVIYPHPKSFEKLIDFYFLRNIDREKTLKMFGELWKISNRFSDKMFSKFSQVFLESRYSWEINEDVLKIAEESLKAEVTNKTEMELKIADIYEDKSNYEDALKYYLKAVDKLEEKDEILKKIFGIYIKKENYRDALELYRKYYEIIKSTSSFKIPVLQILYKLNNNEEIEKILGEDIRTEDLLLEENPILFVDIMNLLGKANEIDHKLKMKLNEVLRKGKREKLYEMGEVFYNLGRYEEFSGIILGSSRDNQEILHDLDRKFRKY